MEGSLFIWPSGIAREMNLDRIITCFMFLLSTLAATGCSPTKPATPTAAATEQAPLNAKPEKLVAQHLPNPVRVHEKVISGGLPEGDAAFAELAALGVKTVISVDGAKPDVAAAEKHGLRYVHLPHGYDGIPDERAALLAKAVRDLPGPIYIHCHHGKHRSPAAAVVGCIGAGLITEDSALAVLELAGTSPNYRGLYQAAEDTQRIDKAKLDALPNDFPATVDPSPLAEAMVHLELTHDHIQALAANNWQMIATKPDLDAAHEALLLREHYTEMLRTDEVLAQDAEFVARMREGETLAQTLETELAAWSKNGRKNPVTAEAGIVLERVSQNCKACHQQFRDVPLSEKK
jgi:protein tyrosine phosphatase (PTP) superfamily phosphohydrolase (DUF442 family)